MDAFFVLAPIALAMLPLSLSLRKVKLGGRARRPLRPISPKICPNPAIACVVAQAVR
jgi:hypothetical protein